MVNLSTALRAAMLGNASLGLRGALLYGAIQLYSGVQPADADSAIPAGATLLGTISGAGAAWVAGTTSNGLLLGTVSAVPYIEKDATAWSGTAVAIGTIGWGRFVGNPVDAGASSLILPRMDMSVGVAGANLNLANINCVVGTPLVVISFRYTLPKA